MAQSHPFLIVKKSDYPTLRSKANKSNFTAIKKFSNEHWNDGYKDGEFDKIGEIFASNTTAYILETNTTKRNRYRDVIYKTINRLPSQTNLMTARVVDAASAQFNAIIALDVVYDSMSKDQIKTCENNLQKVDNWFVANELPLSLAKYGVITLWNLYKNDQGKVNFWKKKYDDRLLKGFVMKDGTWIASPGYVYARMMSDRMGKSSIIHVLEHTRKGSYYNNGQMKNMMTWANRFAITPWGAYTLFGDTGTLTPVGYRSSNGAYYMDKFGVTQGREMSWNLHGKNNYPEETMSYFFMLALRSSSLPKPKIPESQLQKQTGASFWDRTDSQEALQGVLYSLKNNGIYEGGTNHAHENANTISVVGYGQHLIVNSGTRYTTADGKAFRYPGMPPEGGRWFFAKYQNAAIIGDHRDHALKDGNGLIDGLTGGQVEVARTDAGKALRNGTHERTMKFVHPTPGKSNGYFLLFDEVKANDCKEKVNILLQPNTKYGDVITNIPNREYTAPINVFVNASTSDGTEKVTVFYTSSPKVNIEKSYKGAFYTSKETNRLKASYTTDSQCKSYSGTIMFPHDKKHAKAVMKVISNANYNGASINHGGGLIDNYLISPGTTENTRGDITFQGKTVWVRKESGVYTNYAASQAKKFFFGDLEKRVFYGFSSSAPITIAMDGFKGSYESKTDVDLLLSGFNIKGRVWVDGIRAKILTEGTSFAKIRAPKGRHQIVYSPASGGSGGGPTEFKYDVGTTSSAVFAGHARLSNTQKPGSFGWTNTKDIGSRDRGASSRRNSINRDINFSASTRTFIQNVSNGNWNVLITFGDTFKRSNMNVKAEGVTKLSNIATKDSQYLNKSFNVNVTDGKLNLDFSVGKGGDVWSITRIWLRKQGTNGAKTISLEENQSGQNEIIVYPNPAQEALFFSNTEDYNIVNIYNLQGAKVLSMPIESSINVSNLNEGIYMLQFIGNNGSKFKKVIIRR